MGDRLESDVVKTSC